MIAFFVHLRAAIAAPAQLRVSRVSTDDRSFRHSSFGTREDNDTVQTNPFAETFLLSSYKFLSR